MPQGLGKLAGRKNKIPRKKKQVLKKGRKQFKSKKGLDDQIAVTKAINRKNEAVVAAKAVSVGTTFVLTDLAARGEDRKRRQVKERDKKQQGSKITERLQAQLRKMNYGK